MPSLQQAYLAVCCAILLLGGSQAIPQGRRVLALLEDLNLKSTHSIFFGSLTSQGYQITYSVANAADLSIKDWDVYLYDKIIVFASGTAGKRRVRLICSMMLFCQGQSTI